MSRITEPEMKKIVARIGRTDLAFKPVIATSPLCTVGLKRAGRGHYETLVMSILSQQLATKAAATIAGRVKDLAGGNIKPETMVVIRPEDLRSAGVSGAKARAISELTQATLDKSLPFHKFPKMTNEAIAEHLTAIWGIGRWTVEMFLIFHLARMDVWPVGDLGVRRGWEKIHRLPEKLTPEQLDELGQPFAGYQSVVAWYCWRALEGDNATW